MGSISMLITVKEVSNVGRYQDYNLECTIDWCWKPTEIRKWCYKQFGNDYHKADRHQENVRWVLLKWPTDKTDCSIESDELVLLFREEADMNWFILRWS